jgi:hypothetical protein
MKKAQNQRRRHMDVIKEILLDLHKKYLIKMNRIKNITYNTPIDIFIGYNSEYYTTENEGYRAMPIDYVKMVLPKMSPTQWTIFSCLCVRFNYYTLKQDVDEETGEIIYPYKVNHYAFPTIEKLELRTGIKSSTISDNILMLLGYQKNKENKWVQTNDEFKSVISSYASNNRKTIKDKFTNKNKIVKDNRIYYIPLFNRIEYIYYHIYLIENDNRSIEDKKLVKKQGFDKLKETQHYNILTDRDYLSEYCKDPIDKYKEAIELLKVDKEKAMNKYIDARDYQIR